MRLLDPSNPLSSKERVVMGTQVVDILAAKVALHAQEGGATLEKVYFFFFFFFFFLGEFFFLKKNIYHSRLPRDCCLLPIRCIVMPFTLDLRWRITSWRTS